jgi:hypothetical protein
MLARNPASLLSLVAWLKTKDPESCGITAVPLSLSAPSPFHGAGRLLTRPLEGPVEAYARLGNGSMAQAGRMHGRYDQPLRYTLNFRNGSMLLKKSQIAGC